jgi:Beta-lactamase superfamily domain
MLELETAGNATLIVHENGRSVIATDPWMVGTCYHGSWALDRDLSEAEMTAIKNADVIWISHGHPDHLHQDSLDMLPRGKRILVPDHYTPEIVDSLKAQGFAAEIAPYKKWIRLSDSVRVMTIDNENQDAILLIEAGDSLIVNMNDSPFCGEFTFIRSLVRRYGRKTYVAALCAIDADMLNIVDAAGKRVIGPPDERKPGMIWRTARIVEQLGAANFLCSSSQHIYVRADSVWANPYRITYKEIARWWNRPQVEVFEPFVKIDLDDGTFERKHPSQTSNEAAITNRCADDDWSERLSEAEWQSVEKFIRRFETIRPHVDYVEFVVGGERRRFVLSKTGERGVSFHVPRNSLLKTVEYGYFDDLLIGNFMKTELHNIKLYPNFTPRVAKEGGNAKVYTYADRRRFLMRYAKRNPYAFAASRAEALSKKGVDIIRNLSEHIGIKGPLKRIYRWYLGDLASTK